MYGKYRREQCWLLHELKDGPGQGRGRSLVPRDQHRDQVVSQLWKASGDLKKNMSKIYKNKTKNRKKQAPGTQTAKVVDAREARALEPSVIGTVRRMRG